MLISVDPRNIIYFNIVLEFITGLGLLVYSIYAFLDNESRMPSLLLFLILYRLLLETSYLYLDIFSSLFPFYRFW